MQTVKNRTVFCSPVLWASNINSLFSKQSLKGHPLHAYSSASEARRHKLNNDAGLSSVSLSLSESSQSCLTLCNHGLYSPWNSPGHNTGVGSLSLLQGIFPTQGSNPGLLHCGRILSQLSHKGSLSLSLKLGIKTSTNLGIPWQSSG